MAGVDMKQITNVVVDEINNKLEKGGLLTYYYVILPDKILYPANKYDKEVEEGKRTLSEVYARTGVWFSFTNYNYLDSVSVKDIIVTYLRKSYKIKYSSGVLYPGYKFNVLYPVPNLKYYVNVDIKENDTEPDYISISIYNIDDLARALYAPQIFEQKLGNKPSGEITEDDVSEIYEEITYKLPILAGHTIYEASRVIENYFVFHEDKYKDEASKISLAYQKLLPTYQACYRWDNKLQRFMETDCLKLLLKPSS